MRYLRSNLWVMVVAIAAGGLLRAEPVPNGTVYDAAYFHARMEQLLEAWATLDPANAAKFYAPDSDNVYFDLAPLKYNGWKAYAEGSKELLAGFSSAKFTLGDDVAVHRHGTLTWTTATWTLDAVTKAGEKQTLLGRVTDIWEMRGTRWLIVHEHFSVPLAPPPKAGAELGAESVSPQGR
jgi:ketosteroid isomerase-like protein